MVGVRRLGRFRGRRVRMGDMGIVNTCLKMIERWFNGVIVGY